MANLLQTQLLGLAVVCAASAGCQTVPRWNWWPIGQKAPTDSSAVARSAEVELPSVIASKNDSAGGGESADGDTAPPFVPDTPSETSIASTATPVEYPSTGYDSPTVPPATPDSSSLAGQPTNPALPGGAYGGGDYAAGGAGPTASNPATPQTTPYNVAATPPASAYPSESIASAPVGNPSTDRYGESPADRYGAPYSARAVGAPSPVQLSAVDASAPGDRYSSPPSTPDYRSAPTSSPENNVGESDRYASQPPTNVLRESSGPVTAPNPAQPAATVASVSPVGAAPAPYRPGGTSDFSGAAQAAYSLATRPTTNPPTAPPESNDDRYAAPPVTPAPANYR